MNFHSDQWIFDKLNQHLEYAEQFIKPELIIGVCLRGSQNYGLDDETSDVDTVLLVTPSIDDICTGKPIQNTTFIMPNNEHIDIIDIRFLRGQILKQSPQFMECLMT